MTARFSARFSSLVWAGVGPVWRVLAVLTAPALLAAGRVPWNSNRLVGSPNPLAPYAVERRFSKLTFSNPVDVGVLPGTGRRGG